ncbi:MAG TPA: MBL fold metallo-hydrolase [Polyangia bacterium]|jgi:7,8-dihydropterin-6-yl-methyl-4-(beta-D-ribofuranosyl)aminobenzene 5'-phosphate synthase|nr:MBL fold metallo-hydrolase [Polyangia bacterium]
MLWQRSHHSHPTRFAAALGLALLLAGPALQAEEPPAPHARVTQLRVLVLSTMLADRGIGEWGFAALVEADGHRFLFDTGFRPDTVLTNARELGVDLSDVTDVILSHHHDDHTGGLLALRRALQAKNPKALSRAHVAPGMFWSRPQPKGPGENNPMVAWRAEYEGTGGVFVEHTGPVELAPGVWLTGPVPRVHPERNWSGRGQVKSPRGLVEDNLPEDQSLVVDTNRGLVLVSGCGHAGMINTLELARRVVRTAPLHAAIGGFHLLDADDRALAWTGGKLREFGIGHLIGAHCTGIEAVFRLRSAAGLDRGHCVVGAVGASFTLDRGIDPLRLAH